MWIIILQQIVGIYQNRCKRLSNHLSSWSTEHLTIMSSWSSLSLCICRSSDCVCTCTCIYSFHHSLILSRVGPSPLTLPARERYNANICLKSTIFSCLNIDNCKIIYFGPLKKTSTDVTLLMDNSTISAQILILKEYFFINKILT